jgi:hypothetical protein
MASEEDKSVAQAIQRSIESQCEDEELRRVLEISRRQHQECAGLTPSLVTEDVASQVTPPVQATSDDADIYVAMVEKAIRKGSVERFNSTTPVATKIVANQVTPPVQATSDDADIYVAMVERAIQKGTVGRFTNRQEQTRLLQEDYGKQIEIGFEYADTAFGFPQLKLVDVESAPADGNCLLHGVQAALPDTHPLHVKDASATSKQEIQALRGVLCAGVCNLDVNARREKYPQITDADVSLMQAWAKQPPDNKCWEYSELIHLILLVEHAQVSCAVYDLQEKSWMFLNTSASMGYSVVLVKTELHYASVAIDTIEDRIMVHLAMQSAAC